MTDRVHADRGKRHQRRVVETYRRLYAGHDSAADRLIATTTDSNFRIRSLVLAQRRAKAANSAWFWMYCLQLGERPHTAAR